METKQCTALGSRARLLYWASAMRKYRELEAKLRKLREDAAAVLEDQRWAGEPIEGKQHSASKAPPEHPCDE